MEMLVFDEKDPDGWILRVERYFSFYRLSAEEMLEAVTVALDGDALRWYRWENKRHHEASLDKFEEFFTPSISSQQWEFAL